MSDKKIEGVEACSNHGCVFGHPGGMGTNGQCHCLDIRPLEDRIRATRNVLALRAALTAERERADELEKRLHVSWAEIQTERRLSFRNQVAALEAERGRLQQQVDGLVRAGDALIEAMFNYDDEDEHTHTELDGAEVDMRAAIAAAQGAEG